jgi:hypothetical protein
MGRVTEAILNLIDTVHRRGRRFRSIAFFIASVLRASDFAVPFRPSEFIWNPYLLDGFDDERGKFI